MSQPSLASKIWIGFGAAAAVTATVGGLGAFAAAEGQLLWAAVAVGVAAAAALGLGAWVAGAARGPARALADEAGRVAQAVSRGDLAARADADALPAELRPAAEAMNGALERLARSVAVTTEALTQLARGELPAPTTGRQAGDLPKVKQAIDAAGTAVGALLEEARALGAAAEKEPFAARRPEGPGRFGDALQTVARGCQALASRIAPRESAAEIEAREEAQRKGARLERVIEFQRTELTRLERSLFQLASGDLSVDLQVGPGDDDTRDVREQFLATVSSLDQLRGAIAALVRDVSILVDAAAVGQLSQRADASKHEGEFRKVVQGVNMTLDAVLAPIREAAQVLEGLAQRDLKARVTGSFNGDHARIKDSVNAAAEALHDALAQVSDAVEQVSSAATQIAASSQAVASGASEQAASLAETSASIESVASMTKQSADNAQQANHLAGTARAAAGEGTAAVEQMQTAMSRIKASAEGTSQIIRDINDIAFQTNLLALNAAVEAARAGEAGRGFAVVAEEVRSLALRAKEAAMKTEELIRQSVKEAVQGEVTAKQVAGKLSEIAGGISKVTDIISEIAAGAREQSSGIDQVNRAVTEMDKVTQQNAASAEQSSSAASELSGQAEELSSMIGSFRLERGERAAPTAPAEVDPPPAPQARKLSRVAARLHAPRPGPAVPASPPSNGARDADKVFPMDDPADVRDF
jgi:methyl-accepting chemotaxis protein